MEKFADPSDNASELELAHTASSVAAASGKVPKVGVHYEHCTSCGGSIEPPGRAKLGYPTCIDCARQTE